MGMPPLPGSEPLLLLLLGSWKQPRKLATRSQQIEDLSRSSHSPARLESSMMSEQVKVARGAYAGVAVEEVQGGHSLDKADIHKAASGDIRGEEADKGTDTLLLLGGKPPPEEDLPSRPGSPRTADSDQIGAKSPRGSDPIGEKARSKAENGEEGRLRGGGSIRSG